MLCENLWVEGKNSRTLQNPNSDNIWLPLSSPRSLDADCLDSFRPAGGAKPAVTENLGEQMQGDLIEFLASTVSGKDLFYIPVFLCVDLRALAFPLGRLPTRLICWKTSPASCFARRPWQKNRRTWNKEVGSRWPELRAVFWFVRTDFATWLQTSTWWIGL